MSTQRILADQSAVLSATFYVDETATADAPVTVTITKADGTAFVTDAATTSTTTGVYQYTLPAQSQLNRLTAVWSGASGTKIKTYVEIAGAHYFSLADLRAVDGLTQAATYSAAVLRSARDRAEAIVEDITGVAWVRRFKREVLSGNDATTLTLSQLYPRSLQNVVMDETVVSDLTPFYVHDYGVVEYDASFVSGATQNIAVEYVHGYDEPPEDIRFATLRLARHLVLGSNSRIDERASAMTTDFGTLQLVTAGVRRPTGLPEVDAVLMRHNHRAPSVA